MFPYANNQTTFSELNCVSSKVRDPKEHDHTCGAHSISFKNILTLHFLLNVPFVDETNLLIADFLNNNS